MTDKNPKSFRGPRAWGLLAALTLTTVAAAWASRGLPSPVPPGPLPGIQPPPVAVGDGRVGVATRVDRGAVLQGGDGLVRMELMLTGAASEEVGALVPADLVVLLDRSGSMTGTKIAQARQAVLDLVERLGPNDRFALVGFNGHAAVEIPLQQASPGSRLEWSQVVRRIQAGGGTDIRLALATGLSLVESHRTAGRASRMLLISDGISDATQVAELARRAARAESIVSSIGVGLDFNEQLMTSVADAGAGNFYFLENASTLARVFEGEFLAARSTVASALSVTLQPGPGIQVVDAAGYPLERDGRGVVFRPGSLFAGQERRLWITYRLPVDAPREIPLGRVSVGYRDGDALGSVVVDDLPRIACVRDESRFRAELDADLAVEALKEEAFGALQQEVALSVGSGRRDEAKKSIERYRRQVEGLVALAPAAEPAAGEMLDELRELEESTDDAFTGADAAQKQKVFAKDNAAKGWEARRSGAKALPEEKK